MADLGYQVFGEDEVRHEALKRSILDVGLALTKLRLQFLTSISNPDVDKIVQADLAWLNSEEPKLSNGLSD